MTDIMERCKARFSAKNHQWADDVLPWIRLATVILECPDIDEFWTRAVEGKEGAQILSGLEDTAERFCSMGELVLEALVRSRDVLHRLGYSVDNPVANERRN